jgi:hypothetical protein
MVDVNLKPHVLELLREILSKTGIVVNEDVCKDWFQKVNLIQIGYDESKASFKFQ